MTRGTTPTFRFTTPFKADKITSGYITFTTQGRVLLDIPISDENVRVTDGFICLKLTQEQTLMFKTCVYNLAQLRLVLSDDKVVASNIVKVNVCDILKEGEI